MSRSFLGFFLCPRLKDCMDLHYIAEPWTLKYHTNITLQVFCKNIIVLKLSICRSKIFEYILVIFNSRTEMSF